VDQRTKVRRLTRAGRPGDENQSLGEVTQPLHLWRDSHLLDGDHRRRNGAENGTGAVTVAQGVPAKASDALDFVREVGVVDLLELGAIVLEHDRTEHLIDFL